MTKAEYLQSMRAGKKKANHALPPSTKPSNSNSSPSSNSTSNPTYASNSKLPKSSSQANGKQTSFKSPSKKPSRNVRQQTMHASTCTSNKAQKT
eukprot:8007197-Ditylum_brightwellii.AAC.1